MDIRYNTFFYTSGDAFKLRGTPAIRADVVANVFAHDRLWDTTLGAGALEGHPDLLWTIRALVDFDGNGRADILWRHANGMLALWFDGQLPGAMSPSWWNTGGVTDLSWTVVSAGDLDFDGRADILWRSTSGPTSVWFMAGGTFRGDAWSSPVPAEWELKGVVRGPR